MSKSNKPYHEVILYNYKDGSVKPNFNYYDMIRNSILLKLHNQNKQKLQKQQLKTIISPLLGYILESNSKKELVDIFFPKVVFDNKLRKNLLSSPQITQEITNQVLSNKLFQVLNNKITIENNKEYNDLKGQVRAQNQLIKPIHYKYKTEPENTNFKFVYNNIISYIKWFLLDVEKVKLTDEKLKQRIVNPLLEYILENNSKQQLVDIFFPKILFDEKLRQKILSSSQITQEITNQVLSNDVFRVLMNTTVANKQSENLMKQFEKKVEKARKQEIHRFDQLLDELQGYVKGQRRKQQLKETLSV